MKRIWLDRYPEGVNAEIELDKYQSLVELCSACCEQYANNLAFTNYGISLTYQRWHELAEAFANYLQQVLKLQKGDRVAIMCPNLLQYPVAMMGILKAGLTVVNVNPLFTVRELEHELNDAEAKAILVLDHFAHVLQEALPQTQIKHVMVTKIGDLFPWLRATLVNFVVKHVKKMVPAWHIQGAINFRQAIKQGETLAHEPVSISQDDLAFLQYTGGTTGVAKGAMLTHRNMLANVEQVYSWVKPIIKPGKEIIVTPLPLYHIFSLTANCLSFMKTGAQNILITNPRDIPGFIKTLSQYKFTALTGVNTLFNGLLRHPDFAKLDFSHLRVALGGGMAVQQAVAEKWQALTGKPLLEGYGLTEASPVVCINPLDLEGYIGSIGLPVPSTDISIRDEQGTELAIGEEGELCVKGPQVMKGYWKRPDETAKVITEDGWLYTGDIAAFDGQGFLHIRERKKDMILVSGFNVYPNEVEDVIAAHPGVNEVAVIGVAHPVSGEVVKAFIVKEDASLSKEAIIAHCRDQLTGYKVPKKVEFREELPKSNVGKILRKELRED